MNENRMVEQLCLHEGIRTRVYQDTEGLDTVGVGYNISARGLDALEDAIGRVIHWTSGDYTTEIITHDEALKALRADIQRVEKATLVAFPYYTQLSEVRQRVVLDMAFNMGYKALGFHNCITAITKQDWSRAARELYNSKWARQVGDGPGGKVDRCDRLAKMLLTNQDYTS